MIYVSNGYDFNPFEGARYGDPNLVGPEPTTGPDDQRDRNEQLDDGDSTTRSAAEASSAMPI